MQAGIEKKGGEAREGDERGLRSGTRGAEKIPLFFASALSDCPVIARRDVRCAVLRYYTKKNKNRSA